MTTAAPEAPSAPETNALTQQYVSTCENLRLVVEQIRQHQIGDTNQYTFSKGEVIVFLNGRYETSDPAEIDWIDNHELCGTVFHKVGFGSEGNTADDPAELVQTIVQLAFKGEYKKIADILVAERGSYKRPTVIAACETVLNEVGDTGSA